MRKATGTFCAKCGHYGQFKREVRTHCKIDGLLLTAHSCPNEFCDRAVGIILAWNNKLDAFTQRPGDMVGAMYDSTNGFNKKTLEADWMKEKEHERDSYILSGR